MGLGDGVSELASDDGVSGHMIWSVEWVIHNCVG